MEVEESDSSSDEEQQVEEANDSSSDEEQEQPMEVEQSDSSSEEEQTMDVDESEAESDQEVKSEQEEQESEEEEEVKEEAMEENEDVDESDTEEEETEKKSEAEEEHEEDQVQSSSSESEEQQAASSSDSEAEEEGEEQEEASSSESEEEQRKAETNKRKSVKVQMPMEVAEPKKKKAKTTHEPEQNEDAGVEGSSLRAALRSLPRELLQDMLVIAAKQHADVLARLKAAAGSDLVHRKVFVGGLSLTTSSKDLREALSAFGEVKDAFVLKDKLTGMSRCFGYVTFFEVEAAQRAMEKHTFDIDGKMVECKSTVADESEYKRHTNADDLTQRKVFVGGLSSTTSSKDLREALSAFGEVKDAFVLKDKFSGKSRCFGFVTFVEVEAAQRAAEKHTFDIDGKMVECRSSMANETDQYPQTSVDEWKRKGAVQSDVDLAQRKVFVGRLSSTTSAKGLKKALSAFGKVEIATVHLDKLTGKSRRFGFVTFIEVEAAQRAVEKEAFEIDGKMVECRFDHKLDQNPPTKDDPKERNLRVRFDTGLENPQVSLRSMLQEFGTVERISVLRDQETGKVKGVAFVMFKRKTGVERALEKPTKMMPNGTIVTCSAWNPDQKSRADPDEEELKEFGDVKTIFVHRDHDGKGRTGFVTFVEKTGSENALKDPVQKLDDGRVVKCKPAVQSLVTPEERRVMVQFGLGLKNPQEVLRNRFSKYGVVEKVDVQRDDDDATEKGRCVAFVTFQDSAAVQRSLREPVETIGRETIKCFPSDELEAVQRTIEELQLIVLFDVGMENPEETLCKLFMRRGKVEKVDVQRGVDDATGKVRGIAFVTFGDMAAVQRALKAQKWKTENNLQCFRNNKRGLEAARRAVEKSAQEVDSNKWPEELNDPATPEEEERTIFVRFQRSPIRAMPDVKKKLLRKFSRVGTVEKIVVPCDRVTGTVRGAASIKFATCAGAQKALETPQIKMAGKLSLALPARNLPRRIGVPLRRGVRFSSFPSHDKRIYYFSTSSERK